MAGLAPLDRPSFHRIAVEAAAENRRAYRATLAGQVVLIRGHQEVGRNGDVHYGFRQFSDVLYLSACALPDIALLLTEDREILLVPKVDETHRVWMGDVPGPELCQVTYGFEEAAYLDDLNDLLKACCDGAEMLVVSECDLMSNSSNAHPLPVRPYRYDVELQSLRVIKSDRRDRFDAGRRRRLECSSPQSDERS